MKISTAVTRVLVVVPVVVALILLAGAPAAAAASSKAHRQARQQAERNLLHATRMLKRWHVGLVDTKTGLLRQNTTATCRGTGRRVAGKYSTFRCVLRHGRHRVAVRYLALAHNGFEAHRASK
jgi:hypothetical protein